MPETPHTLPASERLRGVKAISELLDRGKYLSAGCLRMCHAPSGAEVSRILVSVPKRSFKRAVKRNLLKRHIRESYRLEKAILTGAPQDMMFVYTAREVLPFSEVRSSMHTLLEALGR